MDEELLARMEEADRGDAGDSFRVKMPNTRIGEMFGIADQILGGRRIRVVCGDGQTRLARIPGKMRRREWVSQGDLILLHPWDFQDEKADVKYRYSKTQALYLSRKRALPEIVDVFGLGKEETEDEEDSIWGLGDDDEVDEPDAAEPADEDADDDGMRASDEDEGDLWGDDEAEEEPAVEDIDVTDEAEGWDDDDLNEAEETEVTPTPADEPEDEGGENDLSDLKGFFA